MVNRSDRVDAVLEALRPLCDDAADLMTALSDAMVSIYTVGAADPTDRVPMLTLMDLMHAKTMETYDSFMAERGDEVRSALEGTE